jgi:hypothetical protein
MQFHLLKMVIKELLMAANLYFCAFLLKHKGDA